MNFINKRGNLLIKILPGFLVKTIWYIYKYTVFLLFQRKTISKNIKLKNIGKGKRAFVLATGPSINKENLKLLKNEDCFSVSNFFLHDDIDTINPIFHFFGPYHEPLILDNYIEWLRLADKTLPKKTNIILNYLTKQQVEQYNLFPKREVLYIYSSDFAKKYDYDITRPILPSGTGPQMIIQSLIYMGYSKIYLLGCDHNTIQYWGKERIDFYDKKKDIRINATNNKAWNGIIDLLENQINVFKQYIRLNEIAERQGIEIVNLSNESWVENFKKANYNEIIQQNT